MNEIPPDDLEIGSGRGETDSKARNKTQQDDFGIQDLLFVRCGTETLAIFSDETDGILEWKPPVPLPNSPKSVLGIINGRGRILTVLDLTELLGIERPGGIEKRSIVSLRGDEQLGLAVDSVVSAVEMSSESVSNFANAAAEPPFSAVIEVDRKMVKIIDSSQLFEFANRDMDRRRYRS